MSWVYLSFAIVLEVSGTLCMKASHGFTRLTPTLCMAGFYVLSFTALGFAVKRIDVSVAYAIWSGVGMALIAIGGVLWFRESLNAWKVASLMLIIIGIVGLRLTGSGR